MKEWQMLRLLALIVFVPLWSASVRAQDNHCGCDLQKASATGHEACSRTDLPDKCTIVFGQTRSNQTVSLFLEGQGISWDIGRFQEQFHRDLPTSLSRELPVNVAMAILSLPEDRIRDHALDIPSDFTGTLYLAIASSIAAPDERGEIDGQIRIPAISNSKSNSNSNVDLTLPIRQFLDPLFILLLKVHPKEVAFAYFSLSGWEEQENDGTRILVRKGCIEVDYTKIPLLLNVRSPWSPVPGNSCRG